MTTIPNISTESPTVVLFALSAVFLLSSIFCEELGRILPIECIWYWVGFVVFLGGGIFAMVKPRS